MKSIGAAALANLKRLHVRGRDGPEQKEVVIAWDIENARPPPGIPVEDVERAISNAFQHLPRRKRHAFLAAASPRSYAAMTAVYGQDQVNHLLSHTDFMLAPGGAKSTSTDAKLLQRIDDFIERQCALGRASYSVLVLITGDDDYTPRVKRAMHAGMDVELLHPAGITSRSLMATLEGRANVWHAEWQQFLEYWINANSSNSGSAGPSGGGQASSRQPQQGGPRASESASGSGKPAAAAAAGGNKGTQPPPPPQQRTPQQPQQAPQPAAAASSRGSDSRSNIGTTSNKERASAVLALSSLPVVRQSCDPDRALVAVCGWLAGERRDNSAFYQSLHAFASECGCKLVVDRDLVTAAAEGGGELTLTCVDDDERHPPRAVQSARDRLRNEINEVLLGDPQVLLLAAMRQQQQQQQQQQSQWQQSQRQQQQPFFQPQPQQPSQPPHNRQPQQAQQQAPAQRAQQQQAAPQVPPPAPPAHGVGSSSSSSSSSRVGKERVSTTLRLPDLDFVRQSDCPEAALAMVLGWLDAARTDNSAFYQSLHALASECGCKLVVDGDLVAARGELTLTCVDDDERHPQRAVQSARDRLRLALDAELRKPGHVLGAKLGSVVVNATKKLCDWLFSPGAAATGGGAGGGRGGGGAAAPPRVEDVEVLLRQRGFCAAAAPPGWVWPASEEQLRAAAKAVVLVEEGLGLAPLPLPDGRALTARPFEPPAVGRQAAARFPEFEVAAVAAMLRSRLQPNELEAQVVWHAAAICDAAASLGPGGWISGGGGHSSSRHCDQQVRGLAAALWLRHCDGAGLCPPPQQAPRPPPAAASWKPAAAAAEAAASSVAAPNASAADDAGSTDTRSSSTPATPATTAPTTAAATPLAALPYPALAALLLRHGHDATVLTDPQLYGTAFALLWLDARAAAAASTAAASTAAASTAAGGTAAGGMANGTAGVGGGGTAADRDGGDGSGGGPGGRNGGGGGAGGDAAAPLVGRLPDGGGWVRVVLPPAFAGAAAARAAVAQVLGSGLSCGELVAALRGLGAAPPPGSEKGEIAGLLAELVIAAAAAASS